MSDNMDTTNIFKNKFVSFDIVDKWVNEDKFTNHPYVKELERRLEKNNEDIERTEYQLFTTNCDVLNSFLSDGDVNEPGLKYKYPYVFELFGKSSLGKTQIMIQLLVATLLEPNIHGGEALYLSTEDNTKIIYRRFKQMFDEEFGVLSEEEEQTLLQRIKFFYCRNLINFVEYQLEDFLLSSKNIRYLFIDSISNDLRHINDNILKHRVFSKITELSFKYKFMVFVTNQVFTFIDEDDEEQLETTKEADRIIEFQHQQINPCMTYEYQLKHITNPLFFNRHSLGKSDGTYVKNNQFEVPTMGFLFNNFVNTRVVLFQMGAAGERFLRIIYSDSWNNASLLNDVESAQLKYKLEKNGLVKFESTL